MNQKGYGMATEKRRSRKEQDNITGRLRPLADRVVVKPVENEQKTKSGIYIPDTAKEKPQEGEIIAVGPGRLTEDGLRIAVDLKVGDRVIYARYGGSEIKIDDQELVIMRESDILARKH
jgi:chaperonin GroES